MTTDLELFYKRPILNSPGARERPSVTGVEPASEFLEDMA